jgi:hypothetical protein
MANLIAVMGNFRFSARFLPTSCPLRQTLLAKYSPAVIINACQRFCSWLVAAVFGVAMIETAICCAGAAPLCHGRFVINRFV